MKEKIECPVLERSINIDECKNIQKGNEKCIICKNYNVFEQKEKELEDTIELSKLFENLSKTKKERSDLNE